MDKKILETMSDLDLVVMQEDLRRSPEDREELQDVLKELGRRAKNEV